MLNKKELADRAGVDLRTIVRWERYQAEPTSDNLDAIATALSFPKAFFFGNDIDGPVCEQTSFRSQTSMMAAEREASLAAGQIAFLLLDWVERRFNLPEPKIPDLHLFGPDGAARMLRQAWRLGERPINNMIQLLESNGVRVFSLAENTAHVNAYSIWRKKVPYVFLNTFKSAESSRFDAAHELAHLVLHQDGGVQGRLAEDQANRFASAFLMPEADVRSVLPIVQTLKQLIAAKKRWRVSLAALNYRVHELKLTSEWKHRGFCIEIIKKGYHRDEPDEIEREKSIVWDKVLKALWSDKMTQIEIADELALPASEVSDLWFGVLNAPLPRETGSIRPLSIVPDHQSVEPEEVA